MAQSRRKVCVGVVYGIGALLTGVGMNATGKTKAKSAAKPRVIKIEARKFLYTPNQIVLKKGELVALELTSIDFMHGFNIPDMKIRADLLPGKITRVTFTPETVGALDFLCDNFCGTGHEEMNGKFIVNI